jgi:hypothetical protein
VTASLRLLKDREEIVQAATCKLLVDLPGRDIPQDQPDNWEQWWARNKGTLPVQKPSEGLLSAGPLPTPPWPR